MSSIQTRFQPRIDSAGRFRGYGAVFGNMDSHRDVIERGAFKASLAAWEAKGRLPAMKLQHGSGGNMFRHDDLPIGRWTTMSEDSHGLWVEGELLAMNTDMGKRLHSLMAGAVLDALSIGFVLKGHRPGSGRIARYLTEIDIREVSLVDTPSNDLARVAPISAADAAYDRLQAALVAVGDGAKPKAAATVETAYDRLQAALRAVKG